MSTRAVVTLTDLPGNRWHVYLHGDGKPGPVADMLKEALGSAWPLPRFEAGQFAASFVAAALRWKADFVGFTNGFGHGVHLTEHWADHPDLDYRFAVGMSPRVELRVQVYRSLGGDNDAWQEECLFDGPIQHFIRRHGTKPPRLTARRKPKED